MSISIHSVQHREAFFAHGVTAVGTSAVSIFVSDGFKGKINVQNVGTTAIYLGVTAAVTTSAFGQCLHPALDALNPGGSIELDVGFGTLWAIGSGPGGSVAILHRRGL